MTESRTADTTKLAYIGDAVYELFIRNIVIKKIKVSPSGINRMATGYVKADSQAAAAKAMLNGGFLTEEETKLLKRARNRTNTSHPRGTSPAVYKWATGFEALVGWLYLDGQNERLDEVMTRAKELTDQDRAGRSLKA
jgi:ribonuclease-3 family protein